MMDTGISLYFIDIKGHQSHRQLLFSSPHSLYRRWYHFPGRHGFAEDGSKLAAISEGGGDWRKIIVLDSETQEKMGDTIIVLKDLRYVPGTE
jgi:prolyl oligopeptidase